MIRQIFAAFLAATLLAASVSAGGLEQRRTQRRLGIPDFEVVVTLDSPDLIRPFVWRRTLTRAQFLDAQLRPRRTRDQVLKEARRDAAARLGFVDRVYGESAFRIKVIPVRDVVLRDNRRREVTSILRSRTIL